MFLKSDNEDATRGISLVTKVQERMGENIDAKLPLNSQKRTG